MPHDKKPTLAKHRRAGYSDRDAFADLARASSQYEAYVRLASIGGIRTLAADETWQHDPSAPLSLELKK